jgi:hypothetical protein
VLLVAAAIALALGTQVVVAHYIQLRGATVQSVPALPSPSPVRAADVGQRYSLGDRFDSIEGAAKAAGFTPLVPAALGRPDQVFYRRDAGVVTLVYGPRTGLPASVDPQVGALVMEARGQVSRPSFGKLVQPGVTLQDVTVGGDPGYWISGAPHGFFFYPTGSGGTSIDTLRLSGEALIWNRGGLVLRLESGLGKEQSIALAQSL